METLSDSGMHTYVEMYRSSKYVLIRYQTDLLKALPIPIQYTDTVKWLPYTGIVQHIH